MSLQDVVLLLGSNLGDSKTNIEEAISLINEKAGSVTDRSVMIYSEPVEFASNNIFCNIAIRIRTELSPACLLMALKDIEQRMGRAVDSAFTGGYSDRIIDLDIVNFDDTTFWSKKLQLPHIKHLMQRDFSRRVLDDLNKIR